MNKRDYPTLHLDKHLNICVTNVHGYIPLVANTSRFFPHSWLITWFVTRLTRQELLVEQELLTLLELLSFILCSNTSVNESYHDRFIYLDKNNNPIIEQPYKMIYMLQCILGYTSNLAVIAFLIVQMNVIVKQRRYSCLCLVNNCQIKINKIDKKKCVLIFRKSYNSWPIIKFETNFTTILANIKYIKMYHCRRGEVTRSFYLNSIIIYFNYIHRLGAVVVVW
jgi:hypothetical protein